MPSGGRMHSGGERAVGKRQISVPGPQSEEKVLHMCMVIITVLSLYINVYDCFIIC